MTVLLRQRESGYNMMLDLERFIKAQDTDYETALMKLRREEKKVIGSGTYFPSFKSWGVVIMLSITALKILTKLKITWLIRCLADA